MSVSKKPMVLVILDGYGYREDQQDNAIYSAKTPVMDALWAKRPHTLIDASGLEVGLPDRQMGNSEVGHVNLGAGRIVYQDLTRLDVEIKERTFFANPVPVSYTHLRAHETRHDLVCRLLLEKKKESTNRPSMHP